MECNLHGQQIEIRDAAGTLLASSPLGSARWPDTSALYWTELSLPAPVQHGIASFSVRLGTAGLVPPHRAAEATFAVMVVPPPKHRLTIRLVAQETAEPISNADIRIGAYRAATDASGRAELHLPKGQYELRIWKVGYDAPACAVHVAEDASIEVAAASVPEENADRAWKG
jgi:hypothetical protein